MNGMRSAATISALRAMHDGQYGMRALRITYFQPLPRYLPPGIRRKIFLTTSLDVAGAQQLAQSGGQAALRSRP